MEIMKIMGLRVFIIFSVILSFLVMGCFRQKVVEVDKPVSVADVVLKKRIVDFPVLQPCFFGYDRFDLGCEAQVVVDADAEAIKGFIKSNTDIAIELQVVGSCDERGSEEYNIGLGARRIQSVKDYLVLCGVPAYIVEGINLGEGKPVCVEHNEGCWKQNRRCDLVLTYDKGLM